MCDLDYMKMAMALALKAKGKTSPNPLVGAVIVKNGKVIADGFHKRCGADHAEVVALKKVRAGTPGATMYVTLEPCGHHGRTPPCTDAIIRSGIKRIFIGTKDPNPVNNGKSIAYLRRKGIDVKVGFLEHELRQMNESFFKFIRMKMPFIVIKWAQTIDGKIATASGSSKWITSDKTRALSHRMRDGFDAILVGTKTVISDDPCLNAANPKKRIVKIILDPKLRIPVAAKLFGGMIPGQVIVATSAKADVARIKQLTKKGVEILKCPTIGGDFDLKYLFRQLAAKNITNILVEGGSRTIGKILKAKLADKAWVFIAPKIVGDQDALSAISGLKARDISNVLKLKNLTVRSLDEDIFIEGDF